MDSFAMENSDDFYESICRVCLSKRDTKTMFSLTDISSSDGLSVYGKAVITFANITLKHDELPNKMCQNCLLLLKHAIVFKKRCELSHQKLEMLRKNQESELKENLSQIVMFTQCFAEEFIGKTAKKCSVVKKNENSFNNETSVDIDIGNDDNFFDNSQEKLDCHDYLLERIEETLKMKRKSLYVDKKRCDTSKNSQKQTKLRGKKQTVQKKKRIPRKVLRNIECKICNKILASEMTYNNHMQRHGNYKYICEHCAKNFATHSELQYHLSSTHNIGRHYTCNVCGFKAIRRFQLMEHERLHTGERPFACDKCGLTFRTQFGWKKHAIYHTEKTIQCQQCPRKFYQHSHMLAHMNNVHERVYVYACSHCDITYAKTATVRRHLIEKHGIAREMQGKIKRINLGKHSITNMKS